MIKKIDIILISTRWYPIDFDDLNDTIINLKSNYKKIILGSSRPEFPTIYNYTYADKFLLENRRFPNKKEKKDLEKLYFQFFNDELKIKVFNKKLKEVALKNEIPFLNFSELLCSTENRTCKVFDNSNKKIYSDFGHLSSGGAAYLVKKIKSIDILK